MQWEKWVDWESPALPVRHSYSLLLNWWVLHQHIQMTAGAAQVPPPPFLHSLEMTDALKGNYCHYLSAAGEKTAWLT